jgi:hypothetical protein
MPPRSAKVPVKIQAITVAWRLPTPLSREVVLAAWRYIDATNTILRQAMGIRIRGGTDRHNAESGAVGRRSVPVRVESICAAGEMATAIIASRPRRRRVP